MANDIIKTQVDETIYENINNEINATAHNAMLKNIVNILGQSQCKGLADVSTNPSAAQLDTNFFYIATTGTYPNLGNITVNAGEFAFIIYNEGTYSKVGIATGGSGGNTFSDQFKLISDVVNWDADYISTDYKQVQTVDLLTVTYIQDLIDFNYPAFFRGTFAEQTNKRLKLECDVRITNDVGITEKNVSIFYSNTLVPSAFTLTSNWQSISISTITGTGSQILLTLGTGSSSVGNGSVFELRNIVVKNHDTDEVITHVNANVYSGTTTIAESTTETEVQVKPLEGTRVQHLILRNAGELPTIPNPTNLIPRETGWLDSDILEGEFAVNIPDEIVFWRAGNNIIEITGGGGGATERPNVTASTVTANGQTTTVDFNVINSNKVPFQDGVTTHTLAFQNMSTTEKNPAIIIDNTANNSGLVVTFDDQSGVLKFNEADGDFPGIFPQMNVAANQKYRIEFYSISATEIDLEFVPQNTLN